MSLEAVLTQTRQRIVPTQREHARMASLADRLRNDIERILTGSGINGTVTLQGSFARDTWVRREADLDIFVCFSVSMERREWAEIVLPTIRKELPGYRVIERYAEHPFLEFHVDGIRVNIVPCYAVEKGQWKSATDRTPYHTEFMKSNLTPELRTEARLLKKFAKGIGVYGAEIKIGGFSGMLIDTLTLYYRSFLETIRQSSSWAPGTRLEIGKSSSIIEPKNREEGVDLEVIDPVDPERNLAAAVRRDKLWTFVAAGHHFLENPALRYFFPAGFAKKTEGQFSRRIEANGREVVAVVFKHPVLVPDVLWGQLMRLEKSMVDLMIREEFEIYRSTIWSDEKTESAILLEADHTILSSIRVQKGPPVAKSTDGASFLQRHLGAKDTVRGPWIEADRWLVEKKRRNSTMPALVRAALREESYGLTVPRQIGATFSNSVRVLKGRSLLPLIRRKDFDETLWRFLEAKPAWLTPAPS